VKLINDILEIARHVFTRQNNTLRWNEKRQSCGLTLIYTISHGTAISTTEHLIYGMWIYRTNTCTMCL